MSPVTIIGVAGAILLIGSIVHMFEEAKAMRDGLAGG
jgi:hypothetical protein